MNELIVKILTLPTQQSGNSHRWKIYSIVHIITKHHDKKIVKTNNTSLTFDELIKALTIRGESPMWKKEKKRWLEKRWKEEKYKLWNKRHSSFPIFLSSVVLCCFQFLILISWSESLPRVLQRAEMLGLSAMPANEDIKLLNIVFKDTYKGIKHLSIYR